MVDLDTPLFHGIAPEELPAMLSCLGARSRDYKKGEIILLEGSPTEYMGIVRSGSVVVELGDAWGNNSILSSIGPGGTFAEVYACIPGEPLMVSVVAAEDTSVLMLHVGRALRACPGGCAYHERLIQNLLGLCAQKSLQLSRRILHTGPKTIRGRLLSYFSERVKQGGSYSFDIPYNRQQLADYLGVDRSALCAELSKMQKDGLLRYQRNHVEIRETAAL